MLSFIKKIKNIEKVYIQTIEGEYVNEAAYVASVAAIFLKKPIQKFDYSELNNLSLTKNAIVIGGVHTVREAITILGETPPQPLDIPDELMSFTKRNIQKGTIGYFLKNTTFPIFVKPTTAKLFAGMIATSKDEFEMLKYVSEEKGEELEVVTSNVVKFISEYRVFIVEGNICDCRKYNGLYNITPDFNFINETIKAYTSQPIAYGIDFGVTNKGETMLIEANDGYALGTYGFDCYNYFKILTLRWNEIFKGI